jgi:hypothetical protein
LAAACFIGVCYFPPVWLLAAPWKEAILGDVISASAILVAYLLTAATILPAIEDKAAVQKLKSWNYFNPIVDRIGSAAYAAGALLVLSILAVPLVDVMGKMPYLKDEVASANRLFSALWWSSLLLTIGLVFVATRILLKLLRAR